MSLRTNKASRKRAGFVYAIYEVGSDKYKIGHGINPERRLQQLQTGNGTKLTIYAKLYFEDRITAERILHSIFSAYRRSGEWFRLDRQGKHLLDIIFGKEQPNELELEQLKRLHIR
jgi:hypothetical protein